MRVYLDHASTTPVDPEVVAEMKKTLELFWGNPSSVHSFGRQAKAILEDARGRVANLIGASPEEIIFTSGGTEADNLAILGTAYAKKEGGNHVITSAIEHHAVLETCKYLQENGFEVTYLPVDREGVVNPEDVRKAIRKDTILISIMHANNEIGTVEPVEEIGRIAREYDIVFHTDAVQTVGQIPVDVEKLGVDLLSLSAHKMYGPKGVGALYVRKRSELTSLMHGGGQERGRRPGTENIPGIAGLGKAAELALQELVPRGEHIEKLRDKLIKGIREMIPDNKLNGHPHDRLPGNVNVTFFKVGGESLLLSLDLKGIAVSTGAACASGALHPSHVLTGIGLDPKSAESSIRMTLGSSNTEEEIDYVLEVLSDTVRKIRAFSSAG